MTHDQPILTNLQDRFIKEYAIDFNGAQAYMRATGKSNVKSAAVQASRILKIPRVAEALELYIEEQLGPQQKRLLENVKFWENVRDDKLEGRFVRLDDVVELLQTGSADLQDTIEEICELPHRDIYRNKTADRLKASESLAKYAQMFVDKHDVNVSGSVQIVDDVK